MAASVRPSVRSSRASARCAKPATKLAPVAVAQLECGVGVLARQRFVAAQCVERGHRHEVPARAPALPEVARQLHALASRRVREGVPAAPQQRGRVLLERNRKDAELSALAGERDRARRVV